MWVRCPNLSQLERGCVGPAAAAAGMVASHHTLEETIWWRAPCGTHFPAGWRGACRPTVATAVKDGRGPIGPNRDQCGWAGEGLCGPDGSRCRYGGTHGGGDHTLEETIWWRRPYGLYFRAVWRGLVTRRQPLQVWVGADWARPRPMNRDHTNRPCHEVRVGRASARGLASPIQLIDREWRGGAG